MLTFYVPDSGAYAGLGHAVCDVDTGMQMSLSGGEIVPARIYEVHKSVSGKPGELCGGFEPGMLGKLFLNLGYSSSATGFSYRRFCRTVKYL